MRSLHWPPVDDARASAREAADAAGVQIRPIAGLDEAAEVVRLQRETWGDDQTVPREMIRALEGAGVPPLAAVRDGRMIGFVLGFAGAGADGLHLHSHMLAVEPGLRSSGVGRALKLAQRAWALENGLSLIRWTFDPLVAANAYFNLEVLGAVADRFHRHYYGEMSDRINRGERTDRLEVRWDLETPRGRPGGTERRVRIHPDHPALRRADPAAAAEERSRVADELERAFSAGAVAVGFDRERSAYLLL